MIEISHVSKRYDTERVLNDVTLSVAENEVVSIIGHSGSGKSTLLRCIAGLESYESGIIKMNVRKKDGYEGIGMVFKENNLFPHFTVLQNLMLAPIQVLGMKKEQAQEMAEEILDNVELIKSLENINIIGIHIHIGSQIRELHVFENMCNKANAIVEKLESLGFKFRIVDVGGGLGINYDVPENEPIPNFASLFAIVHEYLNVGDKEVHFEFGRSIVGECGELITSVLFNKTTATGRRLLIVDASMTELIRPMLYGSYHNIENITSQEEVCKKYTVVGTACESTDVFDENVSLKKSKRGDLLAIKSAGAYGRSMASQYNMHDLPRGVYSDQLGEK